MKLIQNTITGEFFVVNKNMISNAIPGSIDDIYNSSWWLISTNIYFSDFLLLNNFRIVDTYE